jgi:hypothetical protein
MLQLVLDRTDIVEGGMPPFRIVEVIDIVHDQGTGQLGRQIRSIKGQVAFEGAEERLRHGIVPTVSPSAHATDDPAGLQRGLVLVVTDIPIIPV